MKGFERQQGVAFLLIYFKSIDIFYYLPLRTLLVFWERMQNGGRKSFLYEELDPSYEISQYSGTFVHYLEMISKDLEEREQSND